MSMTTRASHLRISVIIVNFNSGRRLERCLESLAMQTRPADEVIVVDNGSTDGSAAAVHNGAVDAMLIEAGENLGFAAANNRAAERVQGDWLAFLNPDAYPEADWLEEVARAINRYPEFDAFGSLQIDASDPNRIDGAGDVYHASGAPYRGHFGWPVSSAPPEGECFSPCAAAAVYRRSKFLALGGFEESFFCYCEDIDLGYRLRLSGGGALQLKRARVLHEGSGIAGRRSDFSIYYGHRNRIWTYVRNTPTSLIITTLPYQMLTTIGLFFYFVFTGRAHAYVRAVRDGVLGVKQQWPARKKIQAARTASVRSIASAIAWSPTAILNRRAKVWRTSGGRTGN